MQKRQLLLQTESDRLGRKTRSGRQSKWEPLKVHELLAWRKPRVAAQPEGRVGVQLGLNKTTAEPSGLLISQHLQPLLIPPQKRLKLVEQRGREWLAQLEHHRQIDQRRLQVVVLPKLQEPKVLHAVVDKQMEVLPLAPKAQNAFAPLLRHKFQAR